MERDLYFMKLAYGQVFLIFFMIQAKLAIKDCEIPVACIFVVGEEVVAIGKNETNALLNV